MLDDQQERRIYDLYSDTDKARLAAERKAKQWRGIADALALVLRKNGVGGRQWQSAMDLYDSSVYEEVPK